MYGNFKEQKYLKMYFYSTLKMNISITTYASLDQNDYMN